MKKFRISLIWKIWVIITIVILKKNVLLSADVFEKFIATWLKFYGLDPCDYFSSPGCSWDATWTSTYILKRGLREGISYTAKRYAKANNKYMNDYDPDKPSTFISYLEMNNLYGWAMVSIFLMRGLSGSKMLVGLIWCQLMKKVQ